MRKLIVAAVLLGATPAWALDGYQDRRGLFAGLGVGGGFVMPDRENADSEVGAPRVALRVGGGVAEDLTLDLSLDFLFVPDVDMRTIAFWGGGSYYLMPMAFLRAAVGFARLSQDQPLDDISETGLGLFIGGGFEMFINSDLAASFTLGYERQQYSDDYSLNIVGGMIGINWY